MKFFKKSDVIIVTIIVAACLFYWLGYRYFFAEKPARAEIYYRSELIETIPLDQGEERIFSLENHDHVIFHLYPDGSIGFEQSDCPDKVCIRSGKLRMVGQTAACLPNQLILTIVSDGEKNEEEADIIVGK